MALILCHQCLSWVEPFGDQCPQCDFPVDARAPDPTLPELAATIGQIVCWMGDVRFVRDALPNKGRLYETTRGLFFVPHRFERVTLAGENRPPAGWRTRVIGWFQAPISLLWKGSRHRRAAPMQVAVDELRPLSIRDSDQLPLLLMQNPGVFFLSRRAIRKVRRTFSGWLIVRQNNLPLHLKPMGDRSGFHERMRALEAAFHEAVYT